MRCSKIIKTVGVTLLMCIIGARGQLGEDSYMEAYHESHYPGQYFSLDDMPFKMPMEEMQNNSVIPYVIKLAALAAKILLKLTLFKIVVKFIAVVCLFLFIPKLKFDQRSIGDLPIDEGYLDSLTETVKKALQQYEDNNKT